MGLRGLRPNDPCRGGCLRLKCHPADRTSAGVVTPASVELNPPTPIFAVQGPTIEANFVVSETREAKGGLDFKLITLGSIGAGGSRKIERQQVHKLTLTLVAPTGAVTDDMEISGVAPATVYPRSSRG